MPIPILNRALIDHSGSLCNAFSQKDLTELSVALGLTNPASAVSAETTMLDKLELTRRMFMVDNVAGKTDSTTQFASLVRYASNIELIIFPRGAGFDGLIYPPLIAVDYDNLYATDHYGKNKKVKISFSVTYKQLTANEANFEQNLRIAIGVVSGVCTCYGFVRTWLWSRRAGVFRLDGMLILKLLLFVAGNIANGFLIVIYCVCTYFLIFYKMQNVFMVNLPNSYQFVLNYIAAGFALKCLDLIHLFAVQCTADIFFIDWERPKSSKSQSIRSPKKLVAERSEDLLDGFDDEPSGGSRRQADTFNARKTYTDSGVSIWRTVYLANEWIELQTYRKTQPIVTTGCVLLFMLAFGFENLASADPRSALKNDPLQYRSGSNPILRTALVISIMLVSGIIQWFFLIVLWEKLFTDKLRGFADLCSVANTSVFILSQANFGYYIHGHSSSGQSDTDLGGLLTMLASEQGATAPRRGIAADSDDHTYRMALPAGFRKEFDGLYAPLVDSSAKVMKKSSDPSSTFLIVEVYQNLNRFLVHFISRDDAEGFTYRIVRRKALEDFLDGEFDDTTLEGLFYVDNGNSFGDVLYYGNEVLLFVFDTFLLCLIDLLSQNLVLAVAVTLIIQTIIGFLRRDLGRRNLSRKTLVDPRFLI